MSEYQYKLKKDLIEKIKSIKDIKILELGVQKGVSTKMFLKICKQNKGKLYSVDIEDCSSVSKDKNWKFLKSRDDNFKLIDKKFPKNFDVIYIDTLHEAFHVKKLIFHFYKKLKKNGYMFIDDISHLPYLNNEKGNNFYCEINNQETFYKILEIYQSNVKNFDLNFSFIASGLAILNKKNNSNLNNLKKITLRKNSLKNVLRKTWLTLKNRS